MLGVWFSQSSGVSSGGSELEVSTVVLSDRSPALGRIPTAIPLPGGADAAVVAVARDDTPQLLEDDRHRPCEAGDRLGGPSLLLFLGLGMLAGSDGPGGIALDDYGPVQSLGVVAPAFILFGGGLDTNWDDVRGAAAGDQLRHLGVAATALKVGLVATSSSICRSPATRRG